MKVERLRLPEVVLLAPRVFGDERGKFRESWRASWNEEMGSRPFVQDNVSVSRRGVLRGLHFQQPKAQGKLVHVPRGRIYDVAVDVRVGSPTFAHWVGAELSDDNGRLLYIPAGFAHGFLALSDDVVVAYKCTEYYHPEAEHCVRWNDPVIGITWPELHPIQSTKDAAAPTLAEINRGLLPAYE